MAQHLNGTNGSEPYAGLDGLMSARVHAILLVSSLYDSFLLAEAGKLHELMLDEFLALDLRHGALELLPDPVFEAAQRGALLLETAHPGQAKFGSNGPNNHGQS